MKRFFIILFVFYFIPGAFGQSPELKKYTNEDGLVSNRIKRIYQDEDGFLWIATWNGLSKYDGSRFTNYGEEQGIFSMVNDIYEIRKGRLLVAQNNGVVSSIENTIVKNIPGKFIRVNQFISASGNKLYALTDEHGIGEWHNDHLEFLNPSFQQSIDSWVMLNDSLSIYSSIADGLNGYVQILDQHLNPYSLKTITGNPVIFKDSHQRIWIGTTEGLKLISPHQTKNNTIVFASLPTGFPDLPPPLKTTYITSITEDSDGNLWFGTDTDGLVIITKNGAVITIDIKEGMPSNDIYCLFEDREKNMWIGTDLGLVKIPRKNKIVFFGKSQGISDEIRAIIQVSNKKFLLLSSEIKELDLHTRTIHAIADSIHWPFYISPLNQKEALCSETKKTFLYSVQGKVKLPTKSYNGIRLNNDQLLIAKQGQLVLVSQENLLIDSINFSSHVNAFSKDRDGYIWVGTFGGGVYKIKITGDLHIRIIDSLKEQLPEPNIRSLFFDSDNKLWVGMRYKGICCLEKNTDGTYRILHYEKKNGLSDNWVRTICEDHAKNIWVGYSEGVDKLIPGKNSYRIFNYGLMNGISGIVTTILFLDDSSMLFSGYPSVVHAKDDQLDTLPPPPVFITGIRTGNGKKIFIPDLSHKTKLSYKNAQIYFEFSSPQFFNERQMFYSYRLPGNGDTSWSTATNIHNVYYANLRPGSYQFEVRSLGWNGRWGVPKSFSFLVPAPFWEKWWFIALLILLAVSLVYLLYRYRLQQILKLQQVRNRIASDLHDEIGSSLTNINILSSLSKKNISETEKANEFLKRISEEATASSQALDDIIWSVNASNDTLEETITRMRRYAAELFDATGTVKYQFEVDESIATHKLNMEQRRDFYLIFKESLNNILKHAAATEVFISIHTKNDRLLLQIKDNGKGFDITRNSNRNGLKNLHIRTERWKGSVRIDSTVNKGTKIDVSLPIMND